MRNSPPSWLYRRPRLLNLLHELRLASPHSQMIAEEMDCLRKHSSGKTTALEIGTYMGVTASVIAASIANNGLLYCVDPFEAKDGKENPGFQMAKRELKRNNVFQKVKFLLGFSNEQNIIGQIPDKLDFILVDGDHSYEGLKNDWEIVLSKLASKGIVCLHDTTIPKEEPYRVFGSVKYFDEVITKDENFQLLETSYSMNVLMRK